MEKSNKELVKVVTEFKQTSVVVGANVFISTEDARAILARTARKPHIEGEEPEDIQAMLFDARETLRILAKAVIYSGVAPSTTLATIASKYI